MSALLMELYPRLRLRYPMIPEIKLLMPLVELSLPERSGVEQSRTERSLSMIYSFPIQGAEIYLFPIGVA